MLFIKNMVNVQCKLQVKKELEKLEITFRVIDLGVVELRKELTLIQRVRLKENLLKCGLQLEDVKREILIEKIKYTIHIMIKYAEVHPEINYSDYLSEKLNYDYTYLANVFSEVQGITIQQYIILNKIKIVKKLILLDELTLTEISFKLNYSSVAHLSFQFKKVTGLSPSVYKILHHKRAAIMEPI